MFVMLESQFQYTVSMKSLPTMMCMISVKLTLEVNQCD